MKKVLCIFLILVFLMGISAMAETLYNVDDTVIFGSFEQDNDPSNGAEPIEWRVLQVEDGRMLLLSKAGLDCIPYSDSGSDEVIWETSSLRAWLNNDFYNTAFTPEEQASIQLVTLENSAEGYEGWADSGAPTEDRVFLLSCAQVQTLMKGYGLGKISDYAFIRGEYNLSEVDWGWYPWWLRSAGETPDRVAFIASNGRIDYAYPNMRYFTVRPAIWLAN